MANIPTQNNNPGDLKDPATGTFRTFASPEEGKAALYNDLTAKMTGKLKDGNLIDFAKTYAPASDNNDPLQYAANIANKMGVSPDTKLNTLTGRIDDFASAISQNEGYQSPTQTQTQTQAPSGGGYVTPPQMPDLTAQSQLNQSNQPDISSPDKGFLSNIGSGNVGGAVQNVGNFLFPVAGDVSDLMQGKSTKTPVQIAADAALSVLPFIPFVGGAGEAIRGAGLAGQVALGAGAGALSGVAQGQNASDVLKSGALGGVTGGALGGIGKLAGKLGEALPQSIVNKFIPGLNPDEVKYAVSKPLGSVSSMLADSNNSLTTMGKELGKALEAPKYQYIQPTGDEIINKTISQFPNAGLTPEEIVKKITSIVPLQKNLVEKLASGEDMTLKELHVLNSKLGSATFKRVFDDPAVKAGKDIGSALYHNISDVITTAAPETKPIFDNLSKEYALNAGLSKAFRSAGKAKAIGLKDILAIMAGFSQGGFLGGAATLALEKGITNPSVNLKTAGLLKGLGGATAGKIGTSLTPTITRGLINIGGGSNPTNY